MYKIFFKRLFDIIFSFTALILLSPVLIVTYVVVRIKLGKPAIFKQKRPGKNEKIFTLYKFRSMTDEKDSDGNLLPDDKRLTKFGKLLRSSSLDELPELYNILKGDMSLIGPRPLLEEYLTLYNDEQKHRHDVRPGLTGLAQVNGRNSVNWNDRFKEDIFYVNNISFLLDTKIFFKTFLKVFKREGISDSKSATMTKFKGDNN